MFFNTDILIKKNKVFFKKLSDKMNMDYIDAYMISGIMGYRYNEKIEDFDEKEDDLNDISLPRNTLTKRHKKLDFLWSLIYLLEHQNDEKDIQFFKKAFETNDDGSGKTIISPINIDRVKLFHQYALGGVKILSEKTVERSLIEALDLEQCISDLIENIEEYSHTGVFDDFIID